MSTTELILITVVALLTAILSGVAGLGGGIILIGVLAQFVDPLVAIPLHGAIQLMSNVSRSVFSRTEIAWPVVGRFAVVLLPANLAGLAFASAIPVDAGRALLGVFVLVVVWRPQLIRRNPTEPMSPASQYRVAGFSGFLSPTLGATGPFTAPFLRATTEGHRAFVATAAATQSLTHSSKLAAFTIDGYRFGEHLAVVVLGMAAVTLGAWIGSKLIGRGRPETFDRLFKGVLTALGVRLILLAV